MTGSGQEVRNDLTGERLVFSVTAEESDGRLLEMDNYWENADHRVPRHIHPGMEEHWEVVSGVVRFQIGDEEMIARAGDRVMAPAGVPHGSENVGGGPAHIRITMRPALRWEEVVRKLFSDTGRDPAHHFAELLRDYPEELAAP